jgi:cytochrome P450
MATTNQPTGGTSAAHGVVPGPAGAAALRWWYRMTRDPLDAYTGLARRYGDALRLPFGRRHTFYLLSRPEHAEHVLVSNQDNYTKAFTYRALGAFLGDGLLTSEGDTWRRHRRLVQPVFAQRRLAMFVPDMVTATTRATARWAHGDTVDAAAEIRRLTLDVTGRALFGSEMAGESDRVGDAIAQLQRAVFLAAFLPLRSETTLRTLYRRVPGLGGGPLDDLVRRVVARRRSEQAPERPRDLLDLLMTADQDGEPRLDDAELRSEVMTLLLAGHETTAAALTWTLVLLSRYPAARRQLEAEADEVLTGDQAEAADADRLPWTRAVISEAMRLYPPAWTVERDAIEADDVCGTEVPPAATVVVAPYLIHRCSDVWPNPEGFLPERFLDVRHPHYAYLPFGGGRRICVGAGFAMLEATLVLATLARTHRLDLLPGARVPPRAEVTLRPAGPVPMRVVRR